MTIRSIWLWKKNELLKKAYPCCGAYMSTFPFTLSNSTNPGHFRDSDSKIGNPASNSFLLTYLQEQSAHELW